ncbi:MAG: murein L,D-transpeptidase catalytic domain family protein [Bacteroidota bacterium]
MTQKVLAVAHFFILFFFLPLPTTQLLAVNAPHSKTLMEIKYELIKAKNQIALPNPKVFEKALNGFVRMQEQGILAEEKDILSIIDFSLSSCKKRLWVINLQTGEILYHSLVAHGKNTGSEYATTFSNLPSSFQSSLGFYLTGDTYQGKHGLSLYLHGQEKGINDKAKERAIVIHGADYVSKSFIEKYGRLGRSLGCPALPMNLHKNIINTIASKTCLFIFHPSREDSTIPQLFTGI